jgi:hypothetical protein
MADNLLFEQSNESQMTTEPFVSRQVVYVVDQNNGAYNGQIQLDTSSLSNSGKYASYSEAYFEIPLVLTLTGPAAINTVTAAFSAGLKAGYWHLLHSFSVEYNNTSVVQLTPFSNMYIHYKMMTSMSREDVDKIGAGIGFFPESSTSFQSNFNANGNYTVDENPAAGSLRYGEGLANNRNLGVFSLGPFTVTGAIPAADIQVTGRLATGAVPVYADGNALAAAFVAGGRIGRVGPTAAAAADAPVPVTITTTQTTLAAGWVGDQANLGFYKRQQSASFQPTTANYTQGLLSSGSVTQVGKNVFVTGLQTSVANDTSAWYILAKIRLKDMCDFFDKLPLVKGAYLRFIINTNTASHTIQYARRVAAGAASLTVGSTSNIIQGGTSPILYASSSTGQGAQAVADAATTAIAASIAANADAQGAIGNNTGASYTLTVALNIAKVAGTSISHPTLQQCRLYVPLYQMNPVMEEQYLSLNRTKKIVYRDIYQYQTDINPDGGSGSFNVLLTNGIPNPKFIIVIPMIRGASSTTIAAGVGASSGNITGFTFNNAAAPTVAIAAPTWQSPFTCEPATTSPLIALTNFNIQIAGQNMFIQNELYDFEQFTNELQSVNAINGGLVTGLTSGLISETDFQYLYRYYICDVSRRLPAEDRVPKSVQILGTSLSQQPITLYTFIEFEKEIEIDLITGQKIA